MAKLLFFISFVWLLSGCSKLYPKSYVEFYYGNERKVCERNDNTYDCGATVICDDGKVFNCVGTYTYTTKGK